MGGNISKTSTTILNSITTSVINETVNQITSNVNQNVGVNQSIKIVVKGDMTCSTGRFTNNATMDLTTLSTITNDVNLVSDTKIQDTIKIILKNITDQSNDAFSVLKVNLSQTDTKISNLFNTMVRNSVKNGIASTISSTGVTNQSIEVTVDGNWGGSLCEVTNESITKSVVKSSVDNALKSANFTAIVNEVVEEVTNSTSQSNSLFGNMSSLQMLIIGAAIVAVIYFLNKKNETAQGAQGFGGGGPNPVGGRSGKK
jgi:hypothetical protein